MALSVINLNKESRVAIYYDPLFMVTLESHIAHLKKLRSTSLVQLDPVKVHMYLGDFDSMLLDLGIDRQYHWFIARINGIYSNMDFDESTTLIYVPDITEINRIQSSYMVTQRVQL